jgi:hypothetical protein
MRVPLILRTGQPVHLRKPKNRRPEAIALRTRTARTRLRRLRSQVRYNEKTFFARSSLVNVIITQKHLSQVNVLLLFRGAAKRKDKLRLWRFLDVQCRLADVSSYILISYWDFAVRKRWIRQALYVIHYSVYFILLEQ